MRCSVTLLLALAACGNGHKQPSTADAPADGLNAPTGDAPANAVSIAITVGGAPAMGVPVFFQNVDSSVALAAVTDAHGTVGVVMPAGGFVTALEPADGTGVTKLDTFAGVQAGDLLHLDLAPPNTSTGIPVSLTAQTDSSADAYHVYTPCGDMALGVNATGTGSLDGCGTSTTTDFLVTALKNCATPPCPATDIVGWNYATGVTVPAAQNGLPVPVSIPGTTYNSLQTTTFAYAGVPGGITQVNITQSLASSRGRMFDVTTAATPSGGSASAMLAQPADGTMTALTVSEGVPASTENGEQLVYEWGAWNTSYSLNFGAAMLPPYLSAATYDLGKHAITWSELATGVMPDLTRGRLHVDRKMVTTDKAWTWAIVAPRAGTTVALPKLPLVDGFDYNPAASDATSVSDLVNAAVPGGYDAMRAHGFGDLAKLATGTGGRIVVELPYSAPL